MTESPGAEAKTSTNLASQLDDFGKRKKSSATNESISTCASLSEAPREDIMAVESKPSEKIFVPAASGHSAEGPGLRMLKYPENASSMILKDLDADELRFYERLWAEGSVDPMRELSPSFYGVRAEGETSYILLENLTHSFRAAKIMDVKIGARTFLEKEGLSKKPRPDMFQRALKLFPDRLSEKMKAEESMTKFEFMTCRDATTTIGSHSYRIDGVAGYSNPRKERTAAKIKEATTLEDNLEMLTEFASASASDEGRCQEVLPSTIAREIGRQLKVMLGLLVGSRIFKDHEFIGSSILFIADAEGHVRVAWIDFAKTDLVPEGMQITHEEEWIPGNHEDGIIKGWNGLIDAWTEIGDRLAENEPRLVPIVKSSAQDVGKETPEFSVRRMFDCCMCPGARSPGP